MKLNLSHTLANFKKKIKKKFSRSDLSYLYFYYIRLVLNNIDMNIVDQSRTAVLVPVVFSHVKRKLIKKYINKWYLLRLLCLLISISICLVSPLIIGLFLEKYNLAHPLTMVSITLIFCMIGRISFFILADCRFIIKEYK